MPDGLTHVAAGYIGVHRWLTNGRLTLFLVGSLLPDILLSGGRLLFLWHPEHDFLELYLTPLHTPITTVFICLILSQLLQSQIRKTAFLALYAGCLSHFFLDFFQRTIEGPGLSMQTIGGYRWFFPVSWFDIQLGLFWPEEFPYALIVLLPVMIFIGLRKRKKNRKEQSL